MPKDGMKPSELPTHGNTVDRQITNLDEAKAKFCLRALLLAGHVSDNTMQKAIYLAETLRHD